MNIYGNKVILRALEPGDMPCLREMINDPEMEGSTSTELADSQKGSTSHDFIKRNYRYNISLKIKSSGSDRPYDPASEACMDVVIKVADWSVVEMDETLE